MAYNLTKSVHMAACDTVSFPIREAGRGDKACTNTQPHLIFNPLSVYYQVLLFIFDFMKQIKLSYGLSALVDDADFERFYGYNWLASLEKKGRTFYAYRNVKTDILVNGRYRYKKIWMHHEVCRPPQGLQIDHKDRDGLNNQSANLRPCEFSKNVLNRSKRSDSTHKYRGTVKDSQGKEGQKIWRAQIKLGGMRKLSKSFLTEREAAAAYNELAARYHGEFANLNIL